LIAVEDCAETQDAAGLGSDTAISATLSPKSNIAMINNKDLPFLHCFNAASGITQEVDKNLLQVLI